MVRIRLPTVRYGYGINGGKQTVDMSSTTNESPTLDKEDSNVIFEYSRFNDLTKRAKRNEEGWVLVTGV